MNTYKTLSYGGGVKRVRGGLDLCGRRVTDGGEAESDLVESRSPRFMQIWRCVCYSYCWGLVLFRLGNRFSGLGFCFGWMTLAIRYTCASIPPPTCTVPCPSSSLLEQLRSLLWFPNRTV